MGATQTKFGSPAFLRLAAQAWAPPHKKPWATPPCLTLNQKPFPDSHDCSVHGYAPEARKILLSVPHFSPPPLFYLAFNLNRGPPAKASRTPNTIGHPPFFPPFFSLFVGCLWTQSRPILGSPFLALSLDERHPHCLLLGLRVRLGKGGPRTHLFRVAQRSSGLALRVVRPVRRGFLCACGDGIVFYGKHASWS